MAFRERLRATGRLAYEEHGRWPAATGSRWRIRLCERASPADDASDADQECSAGQHDRDDAERRRSPAAAAERVGDVHAGCRLVGVARRSSRRSSRPSRSGGYGKSPASSASPLKPRIVDWVGAVVPVQTMRCTTSSSPSPVARTRAFHCGVDCRELTPRVHRASGRNRAR
jgi:hypothetical protein